MSYKHIYPKVPGDPPPKKEVITPSQGKTQADQASVGMKMFVEKTHKRNESKDIQYAGSTEYNTVQHNPAYNVDRPYGDL